MQRIAVLLVALAVMSPLVAAQEFEGNPGTGIIARAANVISDSISSFYIKDCESAEITSWEVVPTSAESGEAWYTEVTAENTGTCDTGLGVHVYADYNGDGLHEEEVCGTSDSAEYLPGYTVGCSSSGETMPDHDLSLTAYVMLGDDDGDGRPRARMYKTIRLDAGDVTDPDVSVDVPSSVNPGESFSYTVSASDNEDLRSISVSGDDSESRSCSGTSCSLSATDTAPDSGSWSIDVTVEDSAGNVESTSASVSVDEPMGEGEVSVNFISVVFKRVSTFLIGRG